MATKIESLLCFIFSVSLQIDLLSFWSSVCLLVLLITHSHTDYESIACNLIDLFSRLAEHLKTFHSSLFLYCRYITYLTPFNINLVYCSVHRCILMCNLGAGAVGMGQYLNKRRGGKWNFPQGDFTSYFGIKNLKNDHSLIVRSLTGDLEVYRFAQNMLL